MKTKVLFLIMFLCLTSMTCADGFRSGTLTQWGNRGILTNSDDGRIKSIDSWNPDTGQYENLGTNGSNGQWDSTETKYAYYSSQYIDGNWLTGVSVYDTNIKQSNLIMSGIIRGFCWNDQNDGLLVSTRVTTPIEMEGEWLYDVTPLYGAAPLDGIGSSGSNYGSDFESPVSTPDGAYYSTWRTILDHAVSDIWFLHWSGVHYKILSDLPVGTTLFGLQNNKLYYGSNNWIGLRPERDFPGYWMHELWSLDISSGNTTHLSSGMGDVEGISPDGTRFYSTNYEYDSLGGMYETEAIVSIVPEPSSLIVFGGLIAVFFIRRKRA